MPSFIDNLKSILPTSLKSKIWKVWNIRQEKQRQKQDQEQHQRPSLPVYAKHELSDLYRNMPTSKVDLIIWIRNKIGAPNHEYFNHSNSGGLQLQQVPEEYAEFLLFLRERKIESYLEIGVGEGASFFLTHAFMKGLFKVSFAVDDTSYLHIKNQSLKIDDKIDTLKHLDPTCNIAFFNKSSSDFFEANSEKFDFIFIDGDHSYEGVSGDYRHALDCLNEGGSIGFHDINSKMCPGVMKLWAEVKNTGEALEFITSDTCGIGIVTPKQTLFTENH